MTTTTVNRPRPRPAGERILRNVVLTVIIAGIIIFTLVPILMAITGSFFRWNPLNDTFTPVGFDNYARLFTEPLFYTALSNTIVFAVIAIAGRVILGLAFAYALFSQLTKAKTFFRALFFMPTITPLVAVAYVWQLMYHPQFGAFNAILGTDINWLKDPNFALGAIVVMTIWKDFGYAVILFLAGLYAIPQDLIEAAEMDGANGRQRFIHVILPQLKPMTIFIIITSVIAYLQAFIQIMVLTEGGPGTATQTLSYMIYEEAFENYNFGYASAIALMLLVVTAALTALSWKVQSDKDPASKGTTKRNSRRNPRPVPVSAAEGRGK